MFKLIDKGIPLTVEIILDGKAELVPENITVAAAALFCGLESVRKTPVSGSNRLPLCMMGVCYECLMKINGQANQRGCQILVKPGMVIERQSGAAELESGYETEV
ncbi:MAG: (2Fe-2S)-binding protein [Gammaproteobacteria bacterium]|nr:(2Fe-2S)-binding protein [Gammaproteobacteria bacterium]